MGETDKIYDWISNVINSCNHPSHIKPCELLITFYQEKKAEPYLVKALQESLKLKVAIIQQEFKNKEQESKENSNDDEIWNMFRSGEYTVGEISEKLKIDIKKCDKVINKKLKQ